MDKGLFSKSGAKIFRIDALKWVNRFWILAIITVAIFLIVGWSWAIITLVLTIFSAGKSMQCTRIANNIDAIRRGYANI